MEKFKPKKTTDDCMTPLEVYEVVKDWACKEYGIDHEKIIRPFWPGADYKFEHYPDDWVVLDNPPFSILSQICEFYLDRGIKFFLFAPSLTALSGKRCCMKMNHIICDADITYENGAVVRTAFVTNLGDNEIVLQTAPELGRQIAETVAELRRKTVRTVPKYSYPDYIVTAAMLQRYSKYGIDFKVKKSDCVRVSALDSQREVGKAIFGSALLLSERAAAERAAAERAAAERAAAERAAATVWHLSEREKKIIRELSEVK